MKRLFLCTPDQIGVTGIYEAQTRAMDILEMAIGMLYLGLHLARKVCNLCESDAKFRYRPNTIDKQTILFVILIAQSLKQLKILRKSILLHTDLR